MNSLWFDIHLLERLMTHQTNYLCRGSERWTKDKAESKQLT